LRVGGSPWESCGYLCGDFTQKTVDYPGFEVNYTTLIHQMPCISDFRNNNFV